MAPKILVVDDEPDLEILIRQKYRKQIRENELHFEFAQNGLQALEKIEKHRDISLVLSDINMPEMDGLTLLQKLSEAHHPVLKSVIISAYGDMENIRMAMNRGAFDFLTKPIDFTDLEVTVQKTLEQLQVMKLALEARDALVAVQRDLKVASRIQSTLLPRVFPPFPHRPELDIYAEMVTAKEVGGDFYDFYFLDEDRLAFVVGDVSGKGVPAAIYMAVSRTLLKAIAFQVVNPGEVLRRLNTLLIPESDAAMFVTVFYGVLNTKTGDLQYSNAGHNPPYILRNGTPDRLSDAAGLFLGKIDGSEYETAKVQMKPGDTLYLYTDGVTEAMDAEMNMYEEERLVKYLGGSNGSPLEELVQKNLADIRSFCGGNPQSDDITVLSLRYHGHKPA